MLFREIYIEASMKVRGIMEANQECWLNKKMILNMEASIKRHKNLKL